MSGQKAITTTGQLRAALAEAIERASRGDLPTNDGKNISQLANALTKVMSEEHKQKELAIRLGAKQSDFGKLNIG